MLLAFAVTLPWTVVGFWDAAIGSQLAGTGFGGDACRTGGGMKCPRDASAP